MVWFAKYKHAVQDSYRTFKEDVGDESKAHQAVSGFLSRTEQLLEIERKNMAPEAIQAAENVIKEIGVLLKADSELKAPHWGVIQRNLLDNTVGIIHKYQPKLEASSGFWNQLKANLNVLIEKMTGIKDLLSVDKTTYGKDTKLQEKKDAISDMTDDMDSGNFSPRGP